MVKQVGTQAEFDEAVKAGMVLVDFWATWCGPCRMEAKVIEGLLEKRPDLKVAKVNVDEEGDLAEEYGITAIPTLLLIKDGEIADQSVGYLSPEELEAFIG